MGAVGRVYSAPVPSKYLFFVFSFAPFIFYSLVHSFHSVFSRSLLPFHPPHIRSLLPSFSLRCSPLPSSSRSLFLFLLSPVRSFHSILPSFAPSPFPSSLFHPFPSSLFPHFHPSIFLFFSRSLFPLTLSALRSFHFLAFSCFVPPPSGLHSPQHLQPTYDLRHCVPVMKRQLPPFQ